VQDTGDLRNDAERCGQPLYGNGRHTQSGKATIVSDFESASIAAIRRVFGEYVNTGGCFFHLTQSI